jgi:2-polyprenyl-3-methyl-5-hydroxy-6-metoxy-1,4-benzoquinol methylase
MNHWNHNAAYHPFVVQVASQLHGDVLDVGCGEGLLVERLSAVSRTVKGVDRDDQAIRQAETRVSAVRNATVEVADFMTMDTEPSTYDLVTMVATLHHMDLHTGLARARELLRPKGKLVVIGLSANKTPTDYAFSALVLPVVRLLGRVHGEKRDVQVVAVAPREDLREIRKVAGLVVPGFVARRGLYYRYILTWTKAS